MPMNNEELQTLTNMVSQERLRTLLNLTGSQEAALELHQETLRVGAALMTVIATLEIALRNSVCENLSQHFGVANWLLQPPVSFQWRRPEVEKIKAAWDSARRAEYSKLTQAGKHALDARAYPNGRPPNKSHADRTKDRRRQIQVSDGKVIAELTLFFWKRLYGPEYDQSLWRTSLKKTFPLKTLTRANVAIQLEHIYQARNRLAHHEPVLNNRFDNTMSAIEFVVQHLGMNPPSAASPLAKLLLQDITDAKAKAAALHERFEKYRK
jgi:hypothetical protein